MPKQRKARVVVKCVRCRYARGQYTDRGKGKCCAKCSRGASKDQRSIPNRAPMLTSGECESIIFGPASPRGSLLRVGQTYGIVRFEATIPASDGDNPQPIIWDIPVNGFFNELNNPLVHSLIGMVDSYFVPKIIGNTNEDIDLIAYACRGFGFCKLLIMAQGAQFVSRELRSAFIWLIIQQIDRLLEKSLLEVRYNTEKIDGGSSSQLVIWYYAMSKLKTSMKCAKHGQSANLFGSRELFQHVWSWVCHVWDELSNRWKTACRQPDDFYKGFRTPHEEIAKMVRNFTVYFEMSMSGLPVQPSGPVIYNEFHQFDLPTDLASIQQAISSGREAYGDLPTVSPNSQNLGHHSVTSPTSSINNASFNPHGLNGNCQLPFHDAANGCNNSGQGNIYPTGNYRLDEYPGSFQNAQAGYYTWTQDNQIPYPARTEANITSPTSLIPEKSHLSNQGTPFSQHPPIKMHMQSEMLSGDSIDYTLYGAADATPDRAGDEGSTPFSTMHHQGWPFCFPTAPIHPHNPHVGYFAL